MGRSTGQLPSGISRYRAMGALGAKFRFSRAFENKSDAERSSQTQQYLGQLTRVVSIGGSKGIRVRGVDYKYVLYTRGGRERTGAGLKARPPRRRR